MTTVEHAPVTGEERRRSARERVRLSAKLIFGDYSVGCTIRDISASGASLLLPDGRDVPDDVTLVIWHEQAIHAAQVVWRLSPLVALRFKPAPV